MTTMNLFDMVDTWNSAGTTFSAIKMNVTDTASASGSRLIDLQVGGTSQFSVDKSGRAELATDLWLKTNATNRGLYFGSAADILLVRDAADTLALRRDTNPQTFRIYNTYTDASNYERGEIRWNANIFEIRNAGLGTGTNRTTRIQNVWDFTSSGHLLSVTDNTYDIGASGANRPRNLFLGGTATLNGSVVISDGQAFLWTSRTLIRSPADGVMRLSNNAETDFNRLQFGGATSSFPALKRNGAMIETRLADDSGFAAHGAEWISITDGVTAPAAATGRARIYVDTADGDLKVIFADGTIKTIVTDT